ncbi:alpha/beta hydrolase [Nocardia sp. KC 131]|uniref:alpha/beta hydrolase n=1 Tax=Nocardia arseniciresistens TaxID=3392119 RepID=UPI00398F2A03
MQRTVYDRLGNKQNKSDESTGIAAGWPARRRLVVQRLRAWRAAIEAAAVVVVVILATGAASAEPPTSGPELGPPGGYQAPAESAGLPARPAIVRIEPITNRWLRVFVRSSAMNRVVQVQVLLPVDRSRLRPALYLLDGRGAPENASSWTEHGHAVDFFADKNVNVVLTTGGPANLYTDWQKRDPVLGTNKWETFLTRELPPLIDAQFEGNGRNGIEGVSMGGEAAMMLTMRNPGLYRAVAAHSGCYTLASGAGQAQARAIVKTYGGDPDNMFGRPDDPDWLAHDVMTHAAALRGTAIYLSSGSGIPGEHDVPGQVDLPDAITVGGPLEAGGYACAVALADRLTRLEIPATVNLRPTGTHSWPYWADELARSWPTIAHALDIDN